MSDEDWEDGVEALRAEVIAEMEQGYPCCEHCASDIECDAEPHQFPCGFVVNCPGARSASLPAAPGVGE